MISKNRKAITFDRQCIIDNFFYNIISLIISYYHDKYLLVKAVSQNTEIKKKHLMRIEHITIIKCGRITYPIAITNTQFI